MNPPPRYISQLYESSTAAEFGMDLPEFAAILQEISDKYLLGAGSAREVEDFQRSLRLDDLVLARACAAGSERAWEVFIARYRPRLREIAMSITKDEAAARELADSLYAELYGTREDAEGRRISKLALYAGRGSLEGWLRAIAAQLHIDRCRRERRLVSLDEQVAPAAEARPAPDRRLDAAVDAALAELSAEDRFILASWYLDGRTLAEIARMLRVHESTVSRRAEKLVAGLHKAIVRRLRDVGMSRKEAEEMMEADVRDLSVDVRGKLAQENRGWNVP